MWLRLKEKRKKNMDVILWPRLNRRENDLMAMVDTSLMTFQ